MIIIKGILVQLLKTDISLYERAKKEEQTQAEDVLDFVTDTIYFSIKTQDLLEKRPEGWEDQPYVWETWILRDYQL